MNLLTKYNRYLRSTKYADIPKYPSALPVEHIEVFQYNEINPISDQTFTLKDDPTRMYVALEDLKYFPDYVHGVELNTYYTVLDEKIKRLKEHETVTPNRIDPIIAITANRIKPTDRGNQEVPQPRTDKEE